VKLTCKDTFLTKAEFQQLLYIAVSGLPGTEIVTPMDVSLPLLRFIHEIYSKTHLSTGLYSHRR
jgi:hypothetical protein